ncbi:MAG: hypothetical protein ACLVLH_18290 [Eisenbergiella massiliensis]
MLAAYGEAGLGQEGGAACQLDDAAVFHRQAGMGDFCEGPAV